jgi:hypothetical protein
LDPVLPPTLFNVLDLLATKSVPVPIDDLNITQRVTKRRFAEIGRVLEGFQVAHRDGEALVPDADLKTFVGYWENANLEGVNAFFRRYLPYDTFLRFLRTEQCICVPPRTDPDARHRMGKQLKEDKIGLTFVAIDTFKWWGMAVGQVYLSHIGDRNIYWGGEKPDMDTFEKSVRAHYRAIRPMDGFANVGRLADRVCRELKIPFILFEELFIQLCRHRRDCMTSTSLFRTPSSKSPVQTLLSRSEAKRNGFPIEWTNKRFMEDGVSVNGRSVKMVKFQPVKVLARQQEVSQ